MTRNIFISLFFLFLCLSAAGQTGNDLFNRSPIPEAAPAVAGLDRILTNKTFTKEGYLLENDIQEATAGLNKLIPSLLHEGSLHQAAFTWLKYGELLPETIKYARQKRNCFDQAGQLFTRVNDHLGQAWALGHLANSDLDKGKFQAAEKELKQLTVLLKTNHFKGVYSTYLMLASISRFRNTPQDELILRLKALQNRDVDVQATALRNNYSEISHLYEQLKQPANSLTYQQMSYELKVNDLWGNNRLADTIVLNLIKLNRPAEAFDFLRKNQATATKASPTRQRTINGLYGKTYEKLQRYDEAEKYYLVLLKSASQIHPSNGSEWRSYLDGYCTICEFYIRTKQFTKAAVLTDKILKLPQRRMNRLLFNQFEFFKFQTDSAAGNFSAAIQHFLAYQHLYDSTFKAGKIEQIADLQRKYKTANQEKSLSALQIQSRVQQSELQNLKLQKKVFFIGIIMLSALFGVCYWGYLQKQRSNVNLAVKQSRINDQNNHLQVMTDQQEALLTEKGWLLREIHHRVKNNLQTTISLLNMQSGYINNQDALAAIKDSQRRLFTMSLIHQKLYQSENLATIDMKLYIGELVAYLAESSGNCTHLAFEISVDAIELDISLAIPVGLIINEAVNNAIKHAFPHSATGKITVRLYQEIQNYILTISDNGIGLPESYDPLLNNSLGMNLISGLTDQIGGSFQLLSNNGTQFSITFCAANFEPANSLIVYEN